MEHKFTIEVILKHEGPKQDDKQVKTNLFINPEIINQLAPLLKQFLPALVGKQVVEQSKPQEAHKP